MIQGTTCELDELCQSELCVSRDREQSNNDECSQHFKD